MLHARLARRVPSAQPLGAARLRGHVLRFHMRGSDGSGKCNAWQTGCEDDVIHGALYALEESRLGRLHAAEGPGYEFVTVSVHVDKDVVPACLYRARPAWLDDALAPYGWYQAFVVAGARENGLPGDYVTQLENLFARQDPNLWRRLKNGWILRRGQRARSVAQPVDRN